MKTSKYSRPRTDRVKDEVELMLIMVYKGHRRMNIKRDGELLVSLTLRDSVEFTVKDVSDIKALICRYSGPGIEIEYV